MKLAHDSAGFLTGDAVLDIRRSNDLLNAIRSDIAAIKSAVVSIGKGDKVMPPSQHAIVSTRRTSTPDSSIVVTPLPRSAISFDSKSQNREIPVAPNQKAVIPTAIRKRDSSGRFVANGTQQAVEPKTNWNIQGRSQQASINSIGDRVAVTVTNASSSLESVDPTFKAFNEVAQPLARGYQSSLSGGDNRDTRWYRKIFREISLFRKEDTAYNKAAKKSLKNIEDKPTVIDDDGGKSFFGGLIGSILPWLLGAIAGFGPMLLTGIRSVFGGFGLILRTILAGVFSPIGLAIGAAATAAWGMFTENGQKFFSDVGTRISDTWSSAVNLFKETFPGITEKFNAVADSISETFKPITDFLKDKFGFVGDAVASTAKNATNFAKDKAGYGFDIAKDLVSKATAKITGKASDNKAALITEMKRAGITDPEEQAAFLAQNDHESAGFSRLEENLSYSPARLMEISKTARSKGIDAIRAAVAQGPEAVGELLYGRKLGNTEAGDGYKFRGRGFTQLTGRANYAEASKALGIDLVGNPDLATEPAIAARIATWFHQRDKRLVEASQSGNIKMARQRLNGGLNGLDDVVSKYGDYLAEANSGKFATAMASLGPMVVAAPAQSVFMPSPRIPKAPAPVAIQESPGVTVPLSSDSNKRAITVSLPKPDAGQDLLDRRIALLVTGGLSSGIN